MDKVKGKTAFVSGSSRGIGREIAVKLAQQGYHVMINCKKDIGNLREVKEKIKSLGVECRAFLADVGNYEACKKMFAEIEREFESPDVLVNNAGVSMVGLLQDLEAEKWQEILQTNLSSVFHCTSLSIPGMIKRQSGRIINISSVWGVAGASCEVAYSATKGGVNSFTKALAKELAPSKITVNAVAAGAVDTSMLDCFSVQDREEIIASIPSFRLARAAEVADLVLDIIKHPYLTGQVIQLDGAWI